MIRRAEILLAGLSIVALSACGSDPDNPAAAAANGHIENLLPDGTAAVVRIASLDEISNHMASIEMAAGEEKASLDARDLLAMARMPLGEVRLIDGSMPIAIAITSKRATPPTVSLILAATDQEAYIASLQQASISATASDKSNYVAVPLFGQYQPSTAAKSDILANMQAGTVAIHGDLATFAKNYKVLIDSGLDLFVNTIASQIEKTNPGIDGETVGELYASIARAISDSAKTLDIGIDYQNGMLDFHSKLGVRDGTSMSGWSSPAIDLSPLANGMTGEGMFEVLFQMDMEKLEPRYDEIVDTAIDIYPDQFREAMREMMNAYKGIYALISGGMVIEGGMTDDGLRMKAQMAPSDPAAFTEKMTALMTSESVKKIGVVVKDAKSSTEGATKTSDIMFDFDMNKLAELAGGEAPESSPSSEAMLKAFFGNGFSLHTAHRDGRLVMTAGTDRDKVAGETLDATSGSWSKSVQPAYERVRDCNPMVVERIDFGAMMATMMKMLGGPTPPANAAADVVFYGGIRDNEWRFGMSFDVAGIAQMGQAMSPR